MLLKPTTITVIKPTTTIPYRNPIYTPYSSGSGGSSGWISLLLMRFLPLTEDDYYSDSPPGENVPESADTASSESHLSTSTLSQTRLEVPSILDVPSDKSIYISSTWQFAQSTSRVSAAKASKLSKGSGLPSTGLPKDSTGLRDSNGTPGREEISAKGAHSDSTYDRPLTPNPPSIKTPEIANPLDPASLDPPIQSTSKPTEISQPTIISYGQTTLKPTTHSIQKLTSLLTPNPTTHSIPKPTSHYVPKSTSHAATIIKPQPGIAKIVPKSMSAHQNTTDPEDKAYYPIDNIPQTQLQPPPTVEFPTDDEEISPGKHNEVTSHNATGAPLTSTPGDAASASVGNANQTRPPRLSSTPNRLLENPFVGVPLFDESKLSPPPRYSRLNAAHAEAADADATTPTANSVVVERIDVDDDGFTTVVSTIEIPPSDG